MPIKFRCHHCRQFLGISRERAGDVFDCPTCGRTIRVPELDGTVKPLPKLSLDLGDSMLRRALDELADLDQSGGDAIQFKVQPAEFLEGHSTTDKSQSSSPISMAPQAAPKPIELPPVVPSLKAVIPEPIHVANHGTRNQDDAWKAAIELAEGDSSDSPQVEPEPARDKPTLDAPASIGRRSQRQVELNASSWFAMIGVAAMVFTAGFWIGRLTVSESISSSSTAVTNSTPELQQTVVGPLQVTSMPPGIRGRISYRPENGANKPDKGARIIALPVEWNGKAKLQTAGFHASDTPEDQRVARASLQAMGGDIAMTDDAGEFALNLKSGGKHLLVVLSSSLGRADADDITLQTQQLSVYFDRPSQLVGRVMLHIESISWSGEGVQLWDHVFQHRS